MSSAFVELLRKSNLDYLVTKKSLKVGARSDDVIVASFVNPKTKTLQLIVCLDKPESVAMWSTALDEREFQLNARLLDVAELGETMVFFADRINDADFTLTRSVSSNHDSQQESSQVNVTFTHLKNKQSITLQLVEHDNEVEKASFLSKILLHVCKRNEQLSAEVKTQQIRIKDLSTKSQNISSRSSGELLVDRKDQKGNMTKSKERGQMSLINPSSKRRKAAIGVNYDEDNSD